MLKDPNLWKNYKNFKEAMKKVNSLKVFNDMAKRQVALVEKYNNALVNNECQKPFLLQGVKHHRKLFPIQIKKNMIAILKQNQG